jgi:hypothetical protein
MAETALIGVDIDLSLVNRRLAETGELTEKEARHMQRELTNAFKRSARASEDAARQMAKAQSKAARDAEREAKRAAREIERSFNEQASSVRGLFGAALGGIGGDILDLTDTLGGMSQSLMLVGGALATIAIAPEVVRSMHEFAAGAQETADALGRVMTPEEAARAREYQQAVAAATTDMNELKLAAQLAVGQGMVPLVESFGDFARAARIVAESDTVSYFFRLREAVGESKDEFVDYFGVLGTVAEEIVNLPFIIPRAAEAFVDWHDATEEVTGATEDLEKAVESLNRELTAADFDTFGPSVELFENAQKEAEDAEKAAKQYAERMERESIQAIEDANRAQREYEQAVRDATAAMMEQGETIDTSLTVAELGRVNETLREGAELIGSEDKPGTFDKMVEGLGEGAVAAVALADAFSPILGNLEQLAAIEQRQHEARVRQLRDQRAESRETYRDAVNAFDESQADLTAAEQAAQLDYLSRLKQSEEAKREQIREVEREEKRAAREAFKRQKDLQIAQATIDAARNAVVLTGSLAYLMFGAPVAATGIALGQLAAELAVINSTSPPKFHFGTPAASSTGGGVVGIPGAEVPAVLEQGEGVVSRRGMATPGMAELVEAVNAGRAPTGRSMVTDIEADLLAQRLNRPYAPAIRGRALAGTNTFYRGR